MPRLKLRQGYLGFLFAFLRHDTPLVAEQPNGDAGCGTAVISPSEFVETWGEVASFGQIGYIPGLILAGSGAMAHAGAVLPNQPCGSNSVVLF